MTAHQELRIRWEWEAAPSVRAPEHRATWARLEIQAGQDYVTLVEDRQSGSSRRSIYCPLYPLAEWVAYNWWFLQSDARPSSLLAQERGQANPTSRMLPPTVRDRHSLRASGDGFAWPDLLVVPDGGQTRLVWENDRPNGSGIPIRFLTRGDMHVNSELVWHELEMLVTSVLTRLIEQGVTGTVLEKEWEAIRKTSQDEAEYCLAAARLGLDPYGDAEPHEQDIIDAAEALSGNLLTDFLDAVNPSRIKSALAWISSALQAIEEAAATPGPPQIRTRAAKRAADLPEPEALAPAIPSLDVGLVREILATESDGASIANLPPWSIGYQQARIVRSQTVPERAMKFDVEYYVPKVTRSGADRSVQALGSGTGLAQPLVVIGSARPQSSARFTLSRALWHCIWDSSPIFAVTSAHTSRQRIERAFAAELLAPAKGIAAMLESPPSEATPEELEAIARHFGVSPMVIDHQVRNHLLAAA